MKFNYNLEIDNILNKIYKRKIFDLACENNISNIDSKNIESYKNQFKSFEVNKVTSFTSTNSSARFIYSYNDFPNFVG